MPDSRLVESLTFQQDGTTRLTTTRTYDTLNRLLSIVSSNGTAGIVSSHAYRYNSANQRTNATLADGSVWRYGYDKLGQVTSGRKYWADGTPVAGQQFDDSFDDIGNRKFAGKGGDQWGANLRYENYTPNNLNQYTSRTVPGGVDILGAANSNATVTILTGSNGVAAPLPGSRAGSYSTLRKGEYFRGEAWVNNSTGAVWLTLTNSAVVQTATNDLLTNVTGNVLIPKTPEVFAYDADGNLTNDARWSYVWDAENRLVRMVSRTDTPTNVWQAQNFGYDWKGRRISTVVSNWTGSAWTKATDLRFICDGWNLVAILNPQSSILQSFLWGLDLSGSLQGAGGVGGLLQVTVHLGPRAGAYLCAYDGNGNAMALVSAANGTVSAQYEYGPFAESIRGTGPLLKENPFRFSTKFRDDETELIYYGYRYLANGRWLSRDPIAENAGGNLYAFAANQPLTQIDPRGLFYGNPPSGPGFPVPPLDPSKYWYNLCFCKCKTVTVTPLAGIQVVAHRPQIDLGVLVPIKIEIEGNPNLCKCKHQDRGGYSSGVPNLTEHPLDQDVERACSDYTDRPGMVNYPNPPDELPWNGGTEPWHIIYNLTITVTCEGNIGPKRSASGSVTGDYRFRLTYNPDGTVTPRMGL